MSPTETTDAAKADAKKLDAKKTDAKKTDGTNNKDIKREISVEIPAAEVARETENGCHILHHWIHSRPFAFLPVRFDHEIDNRL